MAARRHSAFYSLDLDTALVFGEGEEAITIHSGVKVLYGNIGQPQSPRQEVEPLTFYRRPAVRDENIGETYEI